ncbi:unannotated protein [freshwater metagenome]|uniref:Unannotated protein n=1 Tax=freshwater metagenome TaxID=449393 RepID=A0A6J7RU14_9ZZZZ
MEELQNLDRRGRRADIDRDDFVESEHRSESCEVLRVGRSDLLGKLGRNRLSGLLEPDLFDRCTQRSFEW